MRTKEKIRLVLNILFLLASAITLIMWMTDSSMFFYAGVTALSLKFFEYVIRFINKTCPNC